MSHPHLPSLDAPRLPWHKRIMRERHWLEYWLHDQHHAQWVSSLRDIDERSIEFDDYASQRTTRIRSDSPIVYRLTRYQ